jgi:hypothetical protein
MTMLLLLLALQGTPEDLDVLTLKDGTTRSGRILSETAGQVVLETLIKGAKGQVVGSAKATIEKSAIASIQRASEDARRKAAERSDAFGQRGVRRAEALAKIKPQPVVIDGLNGVRIDGAHFVLESTCDVSFSKDVAVCLDEVFAAYRKFFDVRRNAERKIKVHLFADQAEYVAFQKKRHGDAILNPAYYHPEQNYIAAFNMVQKAEERRVRQDIVTLERQIDTYRADLASAERRVSAQAADIRKKIQDEAAEARRAIRADGGGAKDVRLQQIDRQEKELLEQLKSEASGIQKELAAERKKAQEAIEANRKVIEQNEKTLARQNRSMFETLYHEGFHAFATNHLWESAGAREIPRWLHEGMAAYYEMSAVEAGDLIHGAPHADFVKVCRREQARSGLLPVEKILQGGPEHFLVTHRSQARGSGLYYAQSWALAHYLSTRATREQVAAYVVDVLNGQDPVKAFEKMLGKPCREIDAELRKHLDGLKE